MKRGVLSLFLFIALGATAFSQKLERNEVDEFTGNITKTTSEEVLSRTMKSASFVYFRQVGNFLFLQVKYMANPFRGAVVGEDDLIYLKMKDDSVLKLHCVKTTVSDRGQGARGLGGSAAEGINIPYTLTPADLSILQTKLISKVRINFSDSYTELEVNDKHAQTVQQTAKLIEISN